MTFPVAHLAVASPRRSAPAKARIGVSVLAMIAVLTAGCGGDDTSVAAGSGAPGDSALMDEFMDTPMAEFDGRTAFGDEESQQEMVDAMNDAEQEVAECMREQGFEYTPVDQSAMFGDFDGGGFMEDPFDEEWVKEFGLGISTTFEDSFEQMDDMSAGPDDPNQAIVESLSVSEQEAYYMALYGTGPDFGGPGFGIEVDGAGGVDVEAPGEPDLDAEDVSDDSAEPSDGDGGDEEEETVDIVNDDGEIELEGPGGDSEGDFAEFDDFDIADLDPEQMGCQAAAFMAMDGLFSGGGAEFDQAMEDLDERVNADARIVEAETAWSECMAEGGYEYDGIEDLFNDIEQRMEPIFGSAFGDFEDGMVVVESEAEVGDDGAPADAFADGPPEFEYDEALLSEIQAYELEVAQHNLGCMPDRMRAEIEVRNDLEASFIEENREMLEANKQ